MNKSVKIVVLISMVIVSIFLSTKYIYHMEGEQALEKCSTDSCLVYLIIDDINNNPDDWKEQWYGIENDSKDIELDFFFTIEIQKPIKLELQGNMADSLLASYKKWQAIKNKEKAKRIQEKNSKERGELLRKLMN